MGARFLIRQPGPAYFTRTSGAPILVFRGTARATSSFLYNTDERGAADEPASVGRLELEGLSVSIPAFGWQ
jgi:hypothetical protein